MDWVLTAWFMITVAQGWLMLKGQRAPPSQPRLICRTHRCRRRGICIVDQHAPRADDLLARKRAEYVRVGQLLHAGGVRRAASGRNSQAARRCTSNVRLLAFASIAIVGPAFARFASWKVFGASGAAGGPLFAMPGMLLMMLAVVAYDVMARRKIQSCHRRRSARGHRLPRRRDRRRHHGHGFPADTAPACVRAIG